MILNQDRELTIEVYNGICYICGFPTDGDYEGLLKSTKEHIVPRAKNGDSGYLNVTPCHMICNSIKGHRKFTVGIRAYAQFRVKKELKERGLMIVGPFYKLEDY